MVEVILRFPQAQHLFTPETAPGLLKVKQVIDEDPKIKQWRASDLYKSIRPSRAFPAMAIDPSTGLNDRKGNKAAPL
jgi:hypothetical protein